MHARVKAAFAQRREGVLTGTDARSKGKRPDATFLKMPYGMA